MWTVISALTLYFLSTIIYQRNFFALMPLNSVFQVKNIDGMVWESVFDTFRFSDLFLLLPCGCLAATWFGYFRGRIRGKGFSHSRAVRGTVYCVALWLFGHVCSELDKEPKEPLKDIDTSSSFLQQTGSRIRGKFMTHDDYLFNNGLDLYLCWSIGDIFPHITLDKQERQNISDFIQSQKNLLSGSPRKKELSVQALPQKPNLLIIMIESFETWPLEYRVKGKPALPLMDSLTKAEGTLYFPHLVSQISLGHSSDGHLITLTGLLPLREAAAVTDFADNDYPTLIKAFKEKYGGNAFEIISDNSTIWNQNVTYPRYGFEAMYEWKNMDPYFKSGWEERDSCWSRFTADYMSKTTTPFAGMTVSLSLHTPYRSAIPGYPEIDALPIDPESKHYLKVCRMDEMYISRILDVLKRRGIYEQTIVVITGDHMAFGLAEKHRPPEIADKEKYIPLIVLNSGFKTLTLPETAGQIDIYPTLLDILGLEQYRWPGVGISLLRQSPGAAVIRTLEEPDGITPEEYARQTRAWAISDQMIRANYLNDY